MSVRMIDYVEGLPRRGLAVTAMLGSAALFAVMTAAARMLSDTRWTRPLPTGEITLARFVTGIVVMLPLLFYPSARLLGTDRPGLVWRGLSGGVAVYFYFLAIRYTTLTNAVLMNLTSVIFAPICAWLFLKERISRRAAAGIVVAFGGIVLVTRPTLSHIRLGDLYGLISGVLAGTAITAVRRLRRDETASSVFFYFSLVGAPVALLTLIGDRLVWPDPAGWRLLAVMAVSSIAAQVLMTYGYRYVTTAQGVLLTLSQIIYSGAIGAALFGEPILWTTLVGALMIMTAGAVVSLAPRHAP